jgi:hypothetical protein
MKPSSKHTLGVILIVISVLALVIGFCQIVPIGFVDFPCFDDQVRQQEISSDTHIVYCISVWPLQAISGGAIYDEGTSNQDETKVRDLNLRRDEQTLFVNNHPINPNEVYKTVLWTASINPWLIFTNRFEIKNEGITSMGSNAPSNVLYVSGDVYEGWLPNPLGFIILGSGFWLFRQGKKERKQESNNTIEAG